VRFSPGTSEGQLAGICSCIRLCTPDTDGGLAGCRAGNNPCYAKFRSPLLLCISCLELDPSLVFTGASANYSPRLEVGGPIWLLVDVNNFK
jgi:hypothetical protein